MVSTFSTTGYIALFFFIVSYNFLDKKKIEKLLLIPILLVLFYMAFTNLTFLNEKIEKSVNYSSQGNLNTLDRTRFVSAFLDFRQFLEYPIYGTGKWYNESIYKNFADLQHRNNGVTDFLVKFGLVGFLLYFSGVYKTFSVYNYLFGKNRLNAVFNLTLIFIIGFSEGYFQYAFFISLTFLHLAIRENMDMYFLNKILSHSKDNIVQNIEPKFRSLYKETL